MKKNYLIISVFMMAIAIFTSCKKDVAKIDKTNLVGAWTTEISDSESRTMLFMETNDIYPGAGSTDAFVVITVTDTDTTFAFLGSYDVIEGYLKTMSGANEYANEILEFTNKKLTLYSDATDDNQRIWKKVKSDWLTDNPLD
ncbi:MAG TPA: hypothetical protein PLL66_01490 [Bacteroidales bacterium]|nr:hypothetical protein [Bacteroidales bacterium]